MERRRNQDDDGRTIADMSQFSTPSLWGHLPKGEAREGGSPEEAKGFPYPEAPYTPREKRLFVFAALKAALLIGLAFLVGLGLVIAGLLGLWHLFA